MASPRDPHTLTLTLKSAAPRFIHVNDVTSSDDSDSGDSSVNSSPRSPSRSSSPETVDVDLGPHSDILLLYGNYRFESHRAILAIRSPVFRAMVEDPEEKELDFPEQRKLSGETVTGPQFEQFLRVLYSPEHYLGKAVLDHSLSDDCIESILHLSHYFDLSVPMKCFFLPMVQAIPNRLKTKFWTLLSWAEHYHVDEVLSTLIDHGGHFHRFYETESVGQESSRLTSQTRIRLLSAQVETLKRELKQNQEMIEAPQHPAMWAFNQRHKPATAKKDIFADLKKRLENSAR
jgi:hypothetical protein